jgi:thiamine biosynthesis lipoprotein
MAHACVSLRRARPLLGTFVEISVCGDDQSRMGRAIDAAFDAVAMVHGLMSFHQADSDVGRINHEAATRPVSVHPWTFQVLQAARELQERTAGLFDITIAPILQDRGLLPCSRSNRATAPRRIAKRIAMAETMTMLPGRRIRMRVGTAIDLGGIAKGFAVDRAVDVLKSRGVSCGLVNAGGDLFAFGKQAHSVHVRDPRDPRRCLCSVDVAEEAMASTGSSFDPFRSEDTSGSAVIDPRSRQPVDRIIGATVRAPSCTIADALTKIVMIDGAAASPLLDHYGASAMMVLADGEACVTPNWKGAASLAA